MATFFACESYKFVVLFSYFLLQDFYDNCSQSQKFYVVFANF